MCQTGQTSGGHAGLIVSNAAGRGIAAEMAVLILGPSSVGKSTFIASDERRDMGIDCPDVAFGFQIVRDGFAPDALIRYNLLHRALAFGRDCVAPGEQWDVLADPVFARIVGSGLIDDCIVLVAPLAELFERIDGRSQVEPFLAARYDRRLWRGIVEKADLARIYGELFETLDVLNIPSRVLFSSSCGPERFVESDRASVPAMLHGSLSAPDLSTATTARSLIPA